MIRKKYCRLYISGGYCQDCVTFVLFVLSNQIFVRAVRENEAETIQRMLAFFKNDTVFVNHRETSSLNAPLHVACKLGFYVSSGVECCICESTCMLSCSVALVLICVLM